MSKSETGGDARMPADAPPTLTMRSPQSALYPPDAAETKLVTLYSHAPHTIRLGMIESADGKAAGPDGSSRSLNGPQDLRILRTLRSQADVVLVGAQTARRERYGDITLPEAMQHARHLDDRTQQVELAIVTRSGNLPPNLDPQHTWIITTTTSSVARKLGPVWQERLIYAGADDISPRTVVRELNRRSMTRILCEGGPTLAAVLLERDLVDDFCLTTSPVVGGAKEPATPAVPKGLTLAHEIEGGGFSIRRWRR